MAEDRRDAQMLKTAAETPLQLQAGKQRLKNNQPGKRGELLVFKTQCGKRVGFTVYLGSTTLYAERFPCHWLDCFGKHILPIRKPFFMVARGLSQPFLPFSGMHYGGMALS